jgi:DNA helicase-2/ATP-dependent DNA helicase PcrA
MRIRPQLTKEQQKVIASKTNRLLVSAVPGAGKTETLCACVRHLLAAGVDPRAIIVVTFSNRTCDELKERIDNKLVTVSTFHAHANRVVHAASNKKMTIPNSGDLNRTLAKAIEKNPKLARRIKKQGVDLRDKATRLLALRFLQATHGDEGLEFKYVSDDDSPYAPLRPALEDMTRLRKRFDRRLHDRGFLAFSEMLRQGKNLLKKIDTRFQHVFVDEYQDMDVQQTELLVAMCRDIKTLRVFGDPNQAIYSFMGTQNTDIARTLGADVTSLSKSHRVTRPTAVLASSILGCSAIESSRDGAMPLFLKCKSQREQEDRVLSLVKRLLSGSEKPSIAILARTRSELRIIERVLLNAGYGVNALHRQSQRDYLMRMLKLLHMINKDPEFFRRKLTKQECRHVEQRISEIGGVSIASEHLPVLRRDLAAVARAESFEGRFSGVKRVMLSLLAKAGADDLRRDVQTELNLWQPIAGRFETVKKLHEFMRNVAEQPKITLSTIHSAKGKEWDHVVLTNFVDGALPHVKEIKRGNVGEEQRLLYVAVTRARERVYLVQAPVTGGSTTYSKRSRFLTKAVRATLQRQFRQR